MLTRAILFVSILCLSVPGSPLARSSSEKTDDYKGTITLSGAWALYPLAIRWGEEYHRIHPGVTVDISAGGAGKGMADCLSGVVHLGMVSRQIYPEERARGAWWVSVARDAVVPTINADNPFKEVVLKSGVSRDLFRGIWITGEISDWGQLMHERGKHAIHVYTRSDACGAAKTWAGFLGAQQEDLLDVGVYGDPGLAEAVRNDIFGIGYNNINFVYDTKSRAQLPGICVLPIDINGNGTIDNEENFYSNRDDIVRAIAADIYPSPPARDLHLVSRGRPQNTLVTRFLEWVLTEGQKFIHESGYISIPDEQLILQMNKLETE
ncbi:MAG: PstS family phosphate ABC transporter substrate-binding protein [candidate division KSB1 bacterium]|jgi:phosphate transport system substrate-binding protein|nr:PstS family phosphate ABC transporter substrate-binding protein [candidate division KSB1 bacterium]